VTGGGGAIEAVLTWSVQSGKTWLWCYSGLTALGTWRVLRQSCLSCCYGSSASQAGTSWRKLSLSCVEDFSFNWTLRSQGRCHRSIQVTWAHQDWGIPFFTASLSYNAPRILVSTVLFAIWALN
jgi:hypothetical protein